MRPVQEEDLLPGRAITLLGVAAIVITVALSAWALWILQFRSRELRPTGEFPERELPPPTQVSDIEQRAFGLPVPGERYEAEARERLRTYGWVDRERRTVFVPIERAMEMYVREGEGR